MPTQTFSKISEALSRACSFSIPVARGTVRLAVIEGGFRPGTVTQEQMTQVLQKVMPKMLNDRGVRHSAIVCKNLSNELQLSSVPLPAISSSDSSTNLKAP